MKPALGLTSLASGALMACCSPPNTKIDCLPPRVLLTELSSVPLLDDMQPLVHVRIDGQHEACFLIDTGAEFSWVSADFTRAAGLPRSSIGATLVDIQEAESSISEVAKISELVVGQLVATNLNLAVLQGLRPDVDGSIGQDILAVLDLVIDGPGSRLLLLPRGSWDEQIRELFQPGNTALAYGLSQGESIPTILVDVAGSGEGTGPFAFQIDTGSGPMTVSPGLIEALGLEPTGTTEAIGLSHAGGQLSTFELEDLHLENLTVSDTATEAPFSRLGWGVLRRAVSVFPADTKQLLLFFEPRWSEAWSLAARPGD